MSYTLAPGIVTARAQALLNALDADVNPANLKLYTGPQPTAGAPPTGLTLLADCELPQPAGTVSGGTLTLGSIADTLIVADGIAAWGRLEDGAGDWCLDGNCGLSGSGALIRLDRLDLVTGGLVRITLGQFVEP